MCALVCFAESLQAIRVTNTTYYGEVGEALSVQCADNGTIDTVQWYIVRGDDRVPMLSKEGNVITIKYNMAVVRTFVCLVRNSYESITKTFEVVIA